MGATKREGGHVKFYPYEKEGAVKVLAMLKGGQKKCWGNYYVVALSHIERGGGDTKSFHSSKGGGRKRFYLVLKWGGGGGGGGHTNFRTHDFPIL